MNRTQLKVETKKRKTVINNELIIFISCIYLKAIVVISLLSWYTVIAIKEARTIRRWQMHKENRPSVIGDRTNIYILLQYICDSNTIILEDNLTRIYYLSTTVLI